MSNLAEQLKNIEALPSNEWKHNTRDLLMQKAREEQQTFKATSSRVFWHELSFSSFAWKPALVYAMIAVVVFGGSGMTVVRANDAVPGDGLFVVKRVIEKSKDFVTTDSNQKVELASAILGNRVDELQRSANRQTVLVSAGSENGSNENVILALREVQKQMHDVEDRFTKLREKESADWKQMAQVALGLNERIRGYKEDLKSVKDEIEKTSAGVEIEAVLENADEINSNALAVIVEGHENGQIEIDTNDLKSRLESHIKDIEEKVASVDDEEKKENVEKAKEVLARANEALADDEYSLVLTLAKDTNDILKLMYGDVNGVQTGTSKEEEIIEDALTEEPTNIEEEPTNIEDVIIEEKHNEVNKVIVPQSKNSSSTEVIEEDLGDEYLLMPEVDQKDEVVESEEFSVGI